MTEIAFSSGCVSNAAGIATIAELLPDDLILSGAENHGSMIEGVRRSGRERQAARILEPQLIGLCRCRIGSRVGEP